MNMRREAILWSIAVIAAVALGLVVVWAAIALAFSRPNFAPLYFESAPYRQDDYSADSVDFVRINPLDSSLEQEVTLEDQTRDVQTSNPMIVPPEPTNIPPQVPTNVPASEPTPNPINTPGNNGNGNGGGNGNGNGNGGGNPDPGNGGGNGNGNKQ